MKLFCFFVGVLTTIAFCVALWRHDLIAAGLFLAIRLASQVYIGTIEVKA